MGHEKSVLPLSRICTMCILWLGIGMNGDCVTLLMTSDTDSQ